MEKEPQQKQPTNAASAELDRRAAKNTDQLILGLYIGIGLSIVAFIALVLTKI